MISISQFRACLCVFAMLVAGAGLAAQRYTFRQYGPSDGLTNLGVNCLLQDRVGYLWVGTDNGLFRYDGKAFQPYGHGDGLPNDEIRSMAEAPDGTLWVATQNGIARSTRGGFTAVDVGTGGLFLEVAFDRRGRMYIELSSGILRGEPTGSGSYRFHMVAPGDIGGLYVHDEDAWFRRDGDLWRLRGDSIVRIGSPAGLPSDRWGAVALDTHDNLWVRSVTRLYEMPAGQERFVDRSQGIPHALVSRLLADSHGRLYVSTSSGVVMLDGDQRSYVDPQHGLPADGVSPVLIDREESLWLGMRGGGLIRRLGHGEWLSWTKQDGLLSDSVWSVLHDSAGRLWVGSSGGLNIFAPDGRLAHAWTARNGLTGDSVFAVLKAPSGDVLVGTAPAGITRFSAEGALLRRYGPASGLTFEQINSLALDGQGRIWAAGSGGFFRSRTGIEAAGDLHFDRVDIPGIPANAYFHDMQVDAAGTVWMTTAYGLARFDERGWHVFGERDGLTSADISAMVLGTTPGEVWVGYRDALGIARLRVHGQHAEVTNFTQHDGLSSDLIYAMVFDRAGRLWASTDNGANVLEQGRWRRYGTEAGLIWDDGDDLALSADEAGNVWIGTSRGLSRFSTPRFPVPDPAAAVALTSIQGAATVFQPTDEPVLPHAQDSLLIQFSGLNLASEAQTRYRYRLLGRTTAWTDTREGSVRFEGLPGGSYVFEVIAAGPNGLWSPVPARFAFTVKRPWWQTWWFVSAGLIVAFLLGRALWWYRVRALVAQKERLEKLVIERTAELQESHRQLEEIAYYDALTGLPNRRMFTEQFRSRLALSRRHAMPFALLLVDLDDFKLVNDTHGHDAGDAVLVQSAGVLRDAVRESDCVARLGGDEFAILLISSIDPRGATDQMGIEMVCKRIVDSFSAGTPFNGARLEAHCSVGVAVYPHDGETQETLYKAADMALYEAKRRGGNTCSRYVPTM